MRLLIPTVVAVFVLATPAWAQNIPEAKPVAASASTQKGFDVAVADYAKALGGGKIGFAARHLESGQQVSVNGSEMFPMASTFKVAVAVKVLSRVDKGEITLEQLVPVLEANINETGQVAPGIFHPGIQLSVANLIEVMIIQSNNTATDMMTALAGGPDAVTANLRTLGIKDQNVNADTKTLLKKFYKLPADIPMREGMRAARAAGAPIPAGNLPRADFDADPNDSTTPLAMTDLLAKIWSGKILSAKSTDFLLGVMSRTTTGDKRLKGLLPEDTPVAHKTGTLGGTINDVGVITLPGGRGQVAVSLYTKGSTSSNESREKAVAEVARSAYDYFMFR
jgi:beta-lactamase class A